MVDLDISKSWKQASGAKVPVAQLQSQILSLRANELIQKEQKHTKTDAHGSSVKHNF